jgi:hypothetical protein
VFRQNKIRAAVGVAPLGEAEGTTDRFRQNKIRAAVGVVKDGAGD